MDKLHVLIAMRTSIGAILVVTAIGIVVGGVVRVVGDIIGWYKEEVRDPYRDLRKEAREARKPRKTLEEVASAHRRSTDESLPAEED